MDRKKPVQLILLSFLCFYTAFTIIADVAHNHPDSSVFGIGVQRFSVAAFIATEQN